MACRSPIAIRGLRGKLPMTHADEAELLKRIITNPAIFGGKPIIRGHRLAVEHVIGMLAAGDAPETILKGYNWLEPEDIRACLLYARRIKGRRALTCWLSTAGSSRLVPWLPQSADAFAFVPRNDAEDGAFPSQARRVEHEPVSATWRSMPVRSGSNGTNSRASSTPSRQVRRSMTCGV